MRCGPIRSLPCFSAFDVVVAAAGYNSFHELLRLGFRPHSYNRQTSVDDQDRARYAEIRLGGPARP